MDLSRVAMVIGKDKLPVLGQARIAVVGLGGVGSYVAESLCRSGVGHLLLIDADKVAASNINRQLPALTSTFGRFKTEVVRQRLLDINPDCEIETVSKFYEPEKNRVERLPNVKNVEEYITRLDEMLERKRRRFGT